MIACEFIVDQQVLFYRTLSHLILLRCPYAVTVSDFVLGVNPVTVHICKAHIYKNSKFHSFQDYRVASEI